MPAIADPRPCCSLVCLVPQASAFTYGGTAVPQPVQMMWVAPISAPEMSFNAGIASNDFADSSAWAWPVQMSQVPLQQPVNATWASSEHAPMQLPMSDSMQSAQDAMSQTCLDTHGVDAPAQFQMDFPGPPQTNLQAYASKSTVRRRLAHEAANQEALSNSGVQPAEQDGIDQAVTGAEAAQARTLVDSLLDQMKLGDKEQQSAFDSFRSLAFDSKASSRAAQMALEEVSVDDAVALSSALRSKIRDAVQSKHANYVVQKILEVIPVARASFIVDELVGAGTVVSRHRYGCRVLCRILEHGSFFDSTTLKLLEEIVDDAEDLSKHEFGSYVIRHILEFGLLEHRHKIVRAISSDLLYYAKHKQGSHVVEAALRFSSEQDQRFIVEQLLNKRDQLLSMTGSQFGRHVAKALLVMQGDLRQQAIEALRPLAPQLQCSRYGKSVLKEVRTASQ